MKIRHRIKIDRENVSEAFISFLKERNAKFDKSNSTIAVVYIYEEDDWKDDLYKFYQAEQTTPIIDVIYSKEEYDNAEWLSIRSKFRFEYPQPDDSFSYKKYTYDEKRYCTECGCGLTQIESFRVNKSPKWLKKHFLMLNWVHDELFISSFAKECIDSNEINGLKFLNVINHKKNNIFDDLHQIYVEHELGPGLMDLKQSVKEYRNCESCGSIKYIYSGKGLTFKKDIFESVTFDILKTNESFGEGNICSKKIIISKKLFQIIKNNGLDIDLVFEPILLA
jgi:hypothetical protein